MTASPLLIGLGGGIVAAVLFASLANNSLLALTLFYLTPLPVLLAGIGWGKRAAQIAFLTAALLVALVLSLTASFAFTLFIGLPGFILSYLMLLRREIPPAESGAPDGQILVEWYPLGRIIAWAALMAGALIGLGLAMLGGDGEGYRQAVRSMFDENALNQLRSILGADFDQADFERFIERFTRYILPAFAAASWLLVMLANLWMATKSASISGQLERPLPRFTTLDYPPYLLGIFVLALALTFTSGLMGLIGTAFLGALACAFLILGLSVLHVTTAGSQFKPFILTLLYVGLMLTPWVAPIVTVLGLAEPLLQIRRRVLDRAASAASGRPPNS